MNKGERGETGDNEGGGGGVQSIGPEGADVRIRKGGNTWVGRGEGG